MGLSTTFLNAFEYEKYDKLPSDEFLESSHKITLDNKQSFDNISDRLENALIFYQVTKETNQTTFISNENIFSRHIRLSNHNDVLTLRISYNNPLKWLPDFANNYKKLRIVEKQLTKENAYC